LTAGLTGTAFPTSFSIPGLDPTLSKLLSIESSIYENPTALSYLSVIETAAGAAITNAANIDPCHVPDWYSKLPDSVKVWLTAEAVSFEQAISSAGLLSYLATAGGPYTVTGSACAGGSLVATTVTGGSGSGTKATSTGSAGASGTAGKSGSAAVAIGGNMLYAGAAAAFGIVAAAVAL
jgi:hypothetical protein